MRIVFYLIVTGIAAVVTYALALLIWKLSIKYRLYPKIRERDVHTRPTPRLGGRHRAGCENFARPLLLSRLL